MIFCLSGYNDLTSFSRWFENVHTTIDKQFCKMAIGGNFFFRGINIAQKFISVTKVAGQDSNRGSLDCL